MLKIKINSNNEQTIVMYEKRSIKISMICEILFKYP